MSRSRVLPLILLPILASACSETEREVMVEAPPVAVAVVESERIRETLFAAGELIAKERAQVAAEIAGTVTEILIEEGQAAAAGDVVLTIDPDRRELDLMSASARLVEAQAALREQRRELERIEQLRARDVAAQARVDQARTQYQLAAARVEAAKAQQGSAQHALDDASVRAPFAGMVASRAVSVGEFVQPGKPLFELVTLDPVEIAFHVPEIDSSRVSLGLHVAVSVAPYPGESFPARVTLVSPTIDARTRTLRVKAELPNPDGRLRPGLFARANLGINERDDVLMVPEEAILRRADGAIVYAVREGRAERVAIETGVFRGGRVEVRGEALAVGDVVVRRGHERLTDGLRVSVRTTDGLVPTPKVASGPAAEGDEL